MALSETLRDELAAVDPRRECDVLAELSGLAHTAGTIHLLGRGRLAVHFDLAASSVARRGFALLRRFAIESEIRTYSRRAFDRSTRYQLHVPGSERALAVFREAGLVDSALAPLDHPPPHVTRRACCRSAYLRGALLGAGSLSAPRAPHLEIRFDSRAGASFLALLLERDDLRLAVVDRGRHAAAYAKGVGTIAETLALAGASDLALVFAERAVVADTRARANRLANADHANLVRAGRAAHHQLRAVQALERTGRLEHLPPELREVARLRLRYPTLPLRELACRCDRPASKTAVHRRLQRLIDLAGMR